MSVRKCLTKFSADIYDNAIRQDIQFKYIHFIPDEKFFASVIEFIEYGLDIKEHFFVVYNVNGGNRNDIYNIWDKYKELCEMYHNIYLCFDESYRLNLVDWEENKNKLEKLLIRAEKIIFHGEFLTEEICIYFQPKIPLLKSKGIFIPWGGKIGSNPYTNHTIDKVLQHVRMILYSHLVNKDKIINHFPLTQNAIWLKSRVSYARLTEYIPKKKNKIKNILISHSAHDYTKAIDTIKYLADIKQSIHIYCITSYGTKEIKDQIEYYGKGYFGNSFKSVDRYMSYKEYVNFLSQIDIAVFGMETLSGRDTLELLFWLGAKVYLKHNSEASKLIKANGYKVNDYYIAKNEILKQKYENPDETWNHSIAENEFNPEKKLEQWKELYNYKFDNICPIY